MSGHSAPSDRSAAFTGLIVGAIFLLVVVFTISKLTSKKYAGHEETSSTGSVAASVI